MNQLTVTAIEHKDVKGKILWYLEITDGETLFHVNVGQKTHDTVKMMETQTKLELENTDMADVTATAKFMEKAFKKAQKEIM